MKTAVLATVWALALAGAVLAQTPGTAPAAAGQTPAEQMKDRAPELSDRQVDLLLEAALAIRDGLEALRELPRTRGNATPRRQLELRVLSDLETFLKVADLSPAELVQLIDSDGGLDWDDGETARAGSGPGR